jgi:hypothetical protein
MKQFKTIDLFVNIILIISFSIYWLIKQDESWITAYFVVGGWQVLSMLYHAYNKCFTYKKGGRYIYHVITFISVITMPLGSVFILFFTAPLMAIYYTCLCYHEVYVKMQRPLAVLK